MAAPERSDSTQNGTVDAAELTALLAGAGYLADDEISLVLWLALKLERPILVEGPAGVGKTELARAAAKALGRELVRLSCYEGLDEAKALYEWDYAKQMLYTQLVRDAIGRATADAPTVADAVDIVSGSAASFFDRRFLVARPLLRALENPTPTVLLIDEVDRADPEFEAFLLELLADMAVTIPELGRVEATHAPLVVLTTNGTREMTEALRRRCLHLFLDYPAPSRELAILRSRLPGIDQRLSQQVTDFVAKLRTLDLKKSPSISESIDWARALMLLAKSQLDPELVASTLGLLLKHHDDRETVEARLGELVP
jgi:MoxR-like ATPase